MLLHSVCVRVICAVLNLCHRTLNCKYSLTFKRSNFYSFVNRHLFIHPLHAIQYIKEEFSQCNFVIYEMQTLKWTNTSIAASKIGMANRAYRTHRSFHIGFRRFWAFHLSFINILFLHLKFIKYAISIKISGCIDRLCVIITFKDLMWNVITSYVLNLMLVLWISVRLM